MIEKQEACLLLLTPGGGIRQSVGSPRADCVSPFWALDYGFPALEFVIRPA